jgi:hypothetical protein
MEGRQATLYPYYNPDGGTRRLAAGGPSQRRPIFTAWTGFDHASPSNPYVPDKAG